MVDGKVIVKPWRFDPASGKSCVQERRQKGGKEKGESPLSASTHLLHDGGNLCVKNIRMKVKWEL
jgi:hypothetical protein